MREFYISKGIYKGTYNIYENVKEFQNAHPNTERFRWARDEDKSKLIAGAWIETLDGFIVQIIRVIQNTNKRDSSLFIKVPMGLFVVSTYHKSGKTFWQKMYGWTKINSHNLSGNYSVGKIVSIRKAKFAGLVSAGINPNDAYVQAGYDYERTKIKLRTKILGLLMDEDVQKTISESIEPYIDKIKDDPAFSDEAMIRYVKDFMLHVRKGSETHLKSIFPLLTLLGKLPQDLKASNVGTKKKDRIQEVQYEDVMPPEQ